MKKQLLALAFCALCISVLLAFSAYGQFASTDFLIADAAGDRIAVYDQNLVFLRYLDTGFNEVVALTLLSPGTSVAAAGRTPGRIKTYNMAGTVTSDFTHANIGSPGDLKDYGPTTLLVGSGNSTSSVARFTTSGTYVQSYGASTYGSVAVLPGDILWASVGSGTIDVFNLITGTLTSTITLDNGQVLADSMFYSASTNTVLITDFGTASVFERTPAGVFVRQFTGGGATLGVTRGPGGDVFATDSILVHRWTATGTFVSTTNIGANVASAGNIIWAGNFVPTAASVSVSGRVTDTNGRGIYRALVSISNPAGAVRTVTTNPFGYFRFDDVTVGSSYIFSIEHKRYSFEPQVISVNDEITDLNFTMQ